MLYAVRAHSHTTKEWNCVEYLANENDIVATKDTNKHLSIHGKFELTSTAAADTEHWMPD